MLSRNGFTNEEIIDSIIELFTAEEVCKRHNILFPHDKIDLKRLIELKNELIELLPSPELNEC